ncbi:MAG: nuclear transport factor 2 family protein [Opitutales bacterium]|nr:nuclear transport factor 2 family protein [Opitutales bacterium]
MQESLRNHPSNKEPPTAKEKMVSFQTPEETLREYEKRLSRQSWDLVKELIHEDAVFIFTESTFRGRDEIRQAFEKTFDLIKEEKFWITDLNWVAEADHLASCEYLFNWEGVIHGTPSSGGGRGSSVLIKTNDGWKIILEHLGPPAK